MASQAKLRGAVDAFTSKGVMRKVGRRPPKTKTETVEWLEKHGAMTNVLSGIHDHSYCRDAR